MSSDSHLVAGDDKKCVGAVGTKKIKPVEYGRDYLNSSFSELHTDDTHDILSTIKYSHKIKNILYLFSMPSGFVT